MKLTDSNIVLIGGFNPHIIEPGWLMREEVVEETRDEFQVEVQLPGVGGLARSIRFELDRIQWEVGLDRIKLASRNGCSPAPWIERLLERLPHTPIRAVGNNFRFVCPRNEWSQPVPALPSKSDLGDALGEPVSSTLVSRTKNPDGTHINITLTIAPQEVIVDANVHRAVANHKAALAAIGSFDQDRDRIRRIVATMSHQEMTS